MLSGGKYLVCTPPPPPPPQSILHEFFQIPVLLVFMQINFCAIAQKV